MIWVTNHQKSACLSLQPDADRSATRKEHDAAAHRCHGERAPPDIGGGGAHRLARAEPSELLFDLGLGDKVVGRTAFCVHPADRVKSVRSVGGTKSIHMDRLRGLRPTHVLVNVDETPRAMAEELAATGCTVVVTHPIKVRDNLALYSLVGGLFGKREEAESLCRRFEGAYDAALRVAERLPERRVLYLIWKDPWMTVARYLHCADAGDGRPAHATGDIGSALPECRADARPAGATRLGAVFDRTVPLQGPWPAFARRIRPMPARRRSSMGRWSHGTAAAPYRASATWRHSRRGTGNPARLLQRPSQSSPAWDTFRLPAAYRRDRGTS